LLPAQQAIRDQILKIVMVMPPWAPEIWVYATAFRKNGNESENNWPRIECRNIQILIKNLSSAKYLKSYVPY
jgi:hypothetical protein